MAFIDLSAVNVALPSLQADLNASGAELIWIVNAYSLMLAALILIGGSLGDHIGRRRVFSAGIVLFGAASLTCGLAPTSSWLIAARAFQGIGGALLIPGSLSIITASIPRGSRGSAIGTWSAFTTVTTIGGPIIGGFLASSGLWRGVFMINIPLAIGALYCVRRWVPESLDEEAKPLDVVGTGLVTLALAGLSFGAVQASHAALSEPQVLVSLLVGFIGLVMFILYESWSDHPLVPLALFRSRTFSGTNALTLLLYGAISMAFFMLPIVMIQAHGYEPRQAGLAMLPFSLFLASLSRWSGGLADRYGARAPLTVGPIVAGIGFFLLSLPGLDSGPSQFWTTYLPAMATVGIGMGITVAPLTTAVMGAVDPRQAGTASGINNAVSRTAGLLTVAVLGSMAIVLFKNDLQMSTRGLNLASDQRSALIQSADRLGDTQPPAGLDDTTRAAVEQAIDHSLVVTFRVVGMICAALGVLGGLVALVSIEGGLHSEKPARCP
jgi:EmrB/QacA subfamily drug resistance transporter